VYGFGNFVYETLPPPGTLWPVNKVVTLYTF
jgi:hypothetical protein